MHAFVVLAGSTPRRPRPSRAARSCCGTRWRSGRPASGTTPRDWPSRSGTGRGRRLDDYRGVNANMHGVEALAGRRRTAVADQDDAGRLRGQALRTHRARGARLGAVGRLAAARALHAPTGQPLPEYNRDRPADPFRPYGVTIGHQFEWARLALHLRAVRPTRPAWLLDDAVALFDAAAGRGWAADGADGFPYTLDWDDRPVVGARMHWVLCEAIAAATVLAAVTGEPRYRDLARPLAGPRRGGCSPTRRPGAGTTSSRRPGRSRAAPGPGSPTPTTWPRCCCSTAARSGAASRPRSADPRAGSAQSASPSSPSSFSEELTTAKSWSSCTSTCRPSSRFTSTS